MTRTEWIFSELRESATVHNELVGSDVIPKQLEDLAQECSNSLRKGGKIIFAGNGGSFADAQHLAAEFVSRLRFERSPLSSVALATNNSSVTAIGNDYGYDQVFVREMSALGREGDIFLPLSTSGNSLNILNAIELAIDLGITVVGFTGASGGRMVELSSCLCVPSNRTERIQEGHILLGHVLCGLVEADMFNQSLQ